MPKREEQSGSGVLTVVLVLLIIAALGAVGYLAVTRFDALTSFFAAPQVNRFAQALEENNYQAAYTLYTEATDKTEENETLQKHLDGYFALCLSEKYDETTWPRYRGLEIFRAQIEDAVRAKLDQIVYAFYQDVLTEEDSRVYLSRVGKFGFTDRYVTDCVDLLKQKDVSRAAYEAGMAHLEAEEYVEAVRLLTRVREQDAQYASAREAIEKCREAYGDKQLARAKEMLEANNKNGARQTAEELVELFVTYPEAEEFLSSILLTAE